MRKDTWIFIRSAITTLISVLVSSQLSAQQDSARMGIGPTLIHRGTVYNFDVDPDRKLTAVYPYSVGIFIKLFDLHFSVGFQVVDEDAPDNFSLHASYFIPRNGFDLLFQKNVQFEYSDEHISDIKTDVEADQLFFNYTHIFAKKEHDFEHAYDLSEDLRSTGGAMTLFTSAAYRNIRSDSILIDDFGFSSLKSLSLALGPGYSHIDHFGDFSLYAHLSAGPLLKWIDAGHSESGLGASWYFAGSAGLRYTAGKFFTGIIGALQYQRYYGSVVDFGVTNRTFQIAAGMKFYSKGLYRWYKKGRNKLPGGE